MKYKVTLKPQNIASTLINKYFLIKEIIYKITRQKEKISYDCKEILEICEKMP